jgi:hypothetical protein
MKRHHANADDVVEAKVSHTNPSCQNDIDPIMTNLVVIPKGDGLEVQVREPDE